ncbi:papain-like cysteine protease family protein [Tunturiibacter gelidoferens]|uniref:Uncharacterized protein n=1 Tax=Tunturiibacter gelidiferens TaxID=3069689 RepID=A0ACC5NTC2_9BACT|nr:papain-like cysteine protease family protein [Edaphobacter lichenicola]MBB5337831.1 hypothetical protein [Edaphobacter lichenicola]
MLNRRKFIFTGSALAISETMIGCSGLNSAGSTITTASVNILQLAQAITTQQCPEWCWAASISMIFAFYGHPVSQSEIVTGTYGGLFCTSANTTTIERDLTGSFIDDYGRHFTSQITAAYDYYNGVNDLTNAEIISELSNNHPMLYCNTHHAEVIYSASYLGSQDQPNIQEVDVIDPWPPNQRSHPLSISEMVPASLGGEMTFAASVRIY